MTVSYRWLLEYLPESLSINDLEYILTAVGLEVEGIDLLEHIKGNLEGVVIGKVLSCEKHPGADRLQVTQVDIGGEGVVQIVCGAPNVRAGQHVLVATPGTTLYPVSGEPFTIKKSKIRGVESLGMICSEAEIGLGEGADGILVLPEPALPGTAASVYLKFPEPDYAIHIGLTPNRADAMSHIGVARDICAWLNHHKGKDLSVRLPDVHLPDVPAGQPVSIQVEAPEACGRYAGVYMEGIQVQASPGWLQERLKAVGLRPVNNIVDITNFVLHEYGQPLHAFDADAIAGSEIHVRFLNQGTPFRTLDGTEIQLHAQDLMVCDVEKGLCMAGVYGGENSGVHSGTTRLFLESAWFDPLYIRRTSTTHGLRTDAAARFEKGADISAVIPALERAVSLIAAIGGGKMISPLRDVYPEPQAPALIETTCSYIRRLSGKDYPELSIRKILSDLGFGLKTATGDVLLIEVPFAKTDVRQPADIAEEILRIDGLDHIPFPGRIQIPEMRAWPDGRKEKETIASFLCGMGFQEMVTNSLTNSIYYPERPDLVPLMNSLSVELDVLRPSMLESGLEVIQYNINRRNRDLCLFEFGTVYHKVEEAYKETAQLALFMTGNIAPASWNRPAEPAGIYSLKGIIEALLQRSGIRKFQVVYEEASISWIYRNETLCSARHIPAGSRNEPEVRQDVYYAVIEWDRWSDAMQHHRIQYREVDKYPAMERDLAIVLDRQVPYRDVEEVTASLKLEALRSFRLFDVFESDKIGSGKKSFALNYTFRMQDRTMTDNETDALMKQLMDAYRKKLQAQIRE